MKLMTLGSFLVSVYFTNMKVKFQSHNKSHEILLNGLHILTAWNGADFQKVLHQNKTKQNIPSFGICQRLRRCKNLVCPGSMPPHVQLYAYGAAWKELLGDNRDTYNFCSCVLSDADADVLMMTLFIKILQYENFLLMTALCSPSERIRTGRHIEWYPIFGFSRHLISKLHFVTDMISIYIHSGKKSWKNQENAVWPMDLIHISYNSDSEKTHMTASILWQQSESDITKRADIYRYLIYRRTNMPSLDKDPR